MSSFRIRVAALAVGLIAGNVSAAEFKIDSESLVGGQFANEQLNGESYGFGCTGANVSPEISRSGAPQGTKSYAITLYDNDAPTGIGWHHWVVVNIPGSQTSLPKGVASSAASLPGGAIQTRTDFGVPGYAGACPPAGETHTYTLTVTALKIATLPINENATPALVRFFMNANALAQAKLVIQQAR